jgi:cytolysin (calcineurin-like family phosphatase)
MWMKTFHLGLMLLLATAVSAAEPAEKLKANLTGYEEVPSVSTPASGQFKATISSDEQTIEYEISYSNLVGTVQQSHIHFAQKAVNGSVVIWLCQTATTPAPAAVAGLTPFCPQSGKVSGTITSANVVAAGTASQQIAAGELAEVIAAIRAGMAYANVHATPLNPGGEIRGQIRDKRGARDDDDEQ